MSGSQLHTLAARLPSALFSGNSKGRWISDDLTILPLQGKAHFGEAQIETNGHFEAAHWCLKRGKNTEPFLNSPR